MDRSRSVSRASYDPSSQFNIPRMFSEYNSELNGNLRSYFDRWRDAPDHSGQTYIPMFLKPSWRLDQASPSTALPRLGSCINSHRPATSHKPHQARPRSASLENRPSWNSQHHLLFGRANLSFHRNFREYFDVKKPPAI
jgi:hypothetical protein